MSMGVNCSLDDLINRQRPGYTLEQCFYRDQEIFEQDLRRVVSQQWLLVDHVSRIPEAGDYFLFEVGDDSIILVRGRDGEVRAHYNVCRHRGSRICLEKEGRAKTLVCPYHAWAYDLNGNLKVARLMPDDFDLADHGLHSCHVRVFEGLIFVCLADGEAPDFDEAYDCFRQFMSIHDLASAKIGHKEFYPTLGNWKLVVENFYECYHCSPSHPQFCAVHSKQKRLAYGAGPGSGPKEAVQAFQEELEEFEAKAKELGYPTGMIDDGEDSLHLKEASRIPIRRGFVSETWDGGPASSLMGGFSEYDGGQTSVCFNPISSVLMTNDCAVLFRFTPRTPTSTDVELTWLVHPDAEEGTDFERDRLIWLWDETTKQDAEIIGNNHRGVLSSRYQPGPYSIHESATDRFVRWYLKRLSDDGSAQRSRPTLAASA